MIPALDAEGFLGDCLDAVQASVQRVAGEGEVEIVVVDNGSSDRTAEVASERQVRVVSEPRRGVSYARNRGIAETTAPIICFLDADCTADPDWLGELLGPFDEADVSCVAGELAHGPADTVGQRQSERKLGSWQRFAVSSDPPFVVTANAAFRRDALDLTGPFDPRMSRAQDVELSLRFNRLARGRVVHAERAVARHSHPETLRAFYRQQRGWAFGAGLCAQKLAAQGRAAAAPTPWSSLLPKLRGLAATWWAGARGRGRPEWRQDALYDFVHQLAWLRGSRAGARTGRKRFASDPWAPEPGGARRTTESA